jgi:hypothetical protein
LSDTSSEAVAVLAELRRRMSPARKWRLIDDARRAAFLFHQAGHHARRPGAPAPEIWAEWVRKTLGAEFISVAEKGGRDQFMRTESLFIVKEVTDYLRGLGVLCAVGGSLASSIYGDDRYTRDADLAATPFPGKEHALATLLGDRYYAPLDAIREANRIRSTFNLIHLETGFKIDVFVQKPRPFERNLILRRQPTTFDMEQPITLDVISPEDVVLLKLEWFRMGGEASDTQWKDVLGVLRTQAGRLDDGYLDQWAADLKVLDLLRKVRLEVVIA